MNALGYLRVMFAVDDIDEALARLRKRGAQLAGEVVQYEDSYRLCTSGGPKDFSSDWQSKSADARHALWRLSVCPERQGKGIGGDLVRTALGIADELNEPLVLVLGFPAYYRRFGFQRASAFGIAPPDGIPDDAWMAVTLSSYSPALRGKVIWPPAFSGVT